VRGPDARRVRWRAVGNRLLTFPLAAIAVLTFIACLRYKPDGGGAT